MSTFERLVWTLQLMFMLAPAVVMLCTVLAAIVSARRISRKVP